MQELIGAFARRSLAELVEAAPQSAGIRSWIQTGSFYVDAASSADNVTLKNVSIGQFLSFQGFDFARFAFSSLESMAYCRSDPSRKRAISWPMLKVYYAGFFGGHAILRAVGQSVVRLEPAQAKKLTEIGRMYCGNQFIVTAGTFDLRITQNADRSVDVSLKRLDETGGAHSIFWRRFYSFLNEMISDIAKVNDPDAPSVIAKLQELQSLLTSKGSSATGTWLSAIRNQINYQHEYGVWFPFGASDPDVRYAARIGYPNVGNTRLDFDAKKEPLRAFCAGNLFIAGLSSDLSTRLASQATKRSAPFVRNWQRLGAETGIL